MKLLVLILIALGPVLIPVRGDVVEGMLESDTETGSVQYKLPGTADFVNLEWKKSTKIPVGTVIKTNATGVAKLAIFPGGKVVIMPNSTSTVTAIGVTAEGDKVTSRSGQIDLSDGTVKSLLSHKGENNSPIDFSIKTPTCVAAAKGTKYVTIYSASDHTSYVFVIDGVVAAGGQRVSAGQVCAIGSTGAGQVVPLTSLPANVSAQLQAAITVATNGGGMSNQVDSASSHSQ